MGLLLLVPVSSHEGTLLLCVEPSGDVNVEQSRNGECAERLSQQNQDRVRFGAVGDNHCTDCIDVSLHWAGPSDQCAFAVQVTPTTDEDRMSAPQATDQATIVGSVPPNDGSALTPPGCTGQRDGDPGALTSSLPVTSSVVLLI